MNAANEQPAGAGDFTSRSSQVSTPGPATEAGVRAGQGRAPGATRPGPCPECGHYGPRIILCHNPDCLHDEASHAIKKDGSRGACSVSSGRKAIACPCSNFTPQPGDQP